MRIADKNEGVATLVLTGRTACEEVFAKRAA
jgi:hypothetical protein